MDEKKTSIALAIEVFFSKKTVETLSTGYSIKLLKKSCEVSLLFLTTEKRLRLK
jgi:hypothetical protein